MANFPEIIARHPAADLGLEGAESHLVQAGNQQLVFMHFTRDVEVPEHSHEAQWGVVLDGEVELMVEGEWKVLRRGDNYFLPAGVRHSARIRRGYSDVTLFDQRERYSIR
ncbi:MAG: cupin domain-containing protein [Deltaproteobacteria bacterium]|nr:cupin domain-containing protein [Deltaproteobacteria bacterium]